MYSKYTHKDWLLGRIRKDLELGIIETSTFRFSRYSYHFLREMFDNGLIGKSDFEIIHKMTYETFSRGSELSIRVLSEKIKESLEQSSYPEELLDFEINEIEEKLGEIGKVTLRSVLRGEWSSDDITEIEVANCMRAEKQNEVLHLSNPSPLPYADYDNSGLELIMATIEDLNNAVSSGKFDNKNTARAVERYLAESRKNKLYDATVLKGYLEKLKKIKSGLGIEGKLQLQGEKNYPSPKEVAKLFIEGAKNPEYSLEDYTSVMKIAEENRDIRSVSAVVRIVKESDSCTDEAKKASDNTIRNWITYYDKQAEVKRKEKKKS